jgi:hypothetical protein
MKKLSSRVSVAAVALALLAAPASAFGRDQIPTRNGNVWHWRDHQPTEAQVERQENAAGIASTQSQRESATTTVDQLYRQLLDSSHT